MIKFGSKTSYPTLEFVFETKGLDKGITRNFGAITLGATENKGFIFAGKAKGMDRELVKKLANATMSNIKRNVSIDLDSFIKNTNVNGNDLVDALVHAYELKFGNVWTMKTKTLGKNVEVNLISSDKEILNSGLQKEMHEAFKEAKILAEIRTWVRGLQVMPPNVLNSENYADIIKSEFASIKGVKVRILTVKEMKKLGMNLLLSVNKGSAHEARLVVLEYIGNESSREKTALVGKGIMHDSGGYNIKPGKFMNGMKYDMSGSAIVAGAIKGIAQLKVKKNFYGVMALTDNSVNEYAQKPDAIWTAMNGKTVEVNNTDAEGRLVLADALTYAVRELGATQLVDIATLTGAIKVALGHTFSGVWATNDKGWKRIKEASEVANENIWRMPLHSDYLEYMRKITVADLKNTDYTGAGGSNSAAMFLKEFTDGVPYIHIDIAATADINETPMAPMVKTLVKL